eukprot:CAMPEP_0183718172 /NCGR_PEP_ID=MMETSP0737-20130205/11502_1 /TAXON_ID=385413 /ORGANISM="Thalassiosira miniscula, Strain CCMP1093" /LENGTH=1066 /DNA_ID=CAMNT_0025947687 /DNA_START=132 /DNA_END=3332 /DNA_ORIENTATION=+
MAATAALVPSASAAAAMDIDENDVSEAELAERLSKTRLGEDDDLGHNITTSATTSTPTNSTNQPIEMNPSEESTIGDELPTPEGFFIDSAASGIKQHSIAESTDGLPPWPTTPPARPSMANPSNGHSSPKIASCPSRPSSSSTAKFASLSPRQSHHQRPLFVSSSSGALIPPPISRSESPSVFDTGEPDNDVACPASRAVAAMRALETNNTNIAISEKEEQERKSVVRAEVGSASSSSGDISRQDTFHTSHHSNERLANDPSDPSSPPPRRTFDAYPSSPNEPFPPKSSAAAASNIPSHLTFSPNTPTGRLLTLLSHKFVPYHKQHTHGGSALAGFLALLLVTCANYMLGPMRDAAALAVGVSHIPALTLASTVLALGSSVPVGWLFEAPNPMRRRVWKRMGLTRGETQGTSLALFYRVFAFLLLSYALGFQLVDRFGRGKEGNDGGGGTNGGDASESAIALVITFFVRLFSATGIPVTSFLSGLERRINDILGMLRMQQQLMYTTRIIATIESYSHQSIPSIFLAAATCIITQFGKVIYIMFFLVVHLMKLHSLSLVWGVTTEAMEYEESAEQRRMVENKKKKDMDGGGMPTTSSAGGLVMMGKRNSNDNETNHGGGKESSSSSNTGGKPSKSSLRLKRLGFVGFGGTLGGIVGSLIASFAAHILSLSGLLIVAAVLLEISANLSIELGRIMQRHWEEQMKYLSCGDLASLVSSESLASIAGQQQQQSTVDSSMRKSASLGSMKRIASGTFSSGNLAKLAAVSQQQSGGGGARRSSLPTDNANSGMTRAKSIGSIPLANEDKASKLDEQKQQEQQQPIIDDNSFKQRLLRGITTILRSRLLMAIFTYNALYASTSVLLSFQRAELVANRSSSGGSSSAVSNTAFLAKINTASSVAVFALQASGLGAYIANCCGQRGALALMPIIRLCGVFLLAWWHWMSEGRPPDLILFLVIDEFTKVINFAIAKPVRENLWRGLSAEARYEAKPIVDTLANRWGGGSAAFLVSFISRITDLTGLGVVNENGERSILGFPPVLLLCVIISAWWTAVSADVGNIRRKIDLELKKQQ